ELDPVRHGAAGTVRSDGDGVVQVHAGVSTGQLDPLPRHQRGDGVEHLVPTARELRDVAVLGAHATVAGDPFGGDAARVPLGGGGEVGQVGEGVGRVPGAGDGAFHDDAHRGSFVVGGGVGRAVVPVAGRSRVAARTNRQSRVTSSTPGPVPGTITV